MWIGAEDGGAAGEDGTACVEGDGDEREEEADIEGYAAANVSFVDAGDYGVDEGGIGDNKGARECGLSRVRMGGGKRKGEAYEGDFHVETFDERFVLFVRHVMFFRVGQAFFNCSGEM